MEKKSSPHGSVWGDGCHCVPATADPTPGTFARVTERWTPGCATRMRGYGAPNRRLADASLAPCNQPPSVPGAFGEASIVCAPKLSWKLLFISRKLTGRNWGRQQEQEEAFGDGQEPNSEIWPAGLNQASKRTAPSAQPDFLPPVIPALPGPIQTMPRDPGTTHYRMTRSCNQAFPYRYPLANWCLDIAQLVLPLARRRSRCLESLGGGIKRTKHEAMSGSCSRSQAVDCVTPTVPIVPNTPNPPWTAVTPLEPFRRINSLVSVGGGPWPLFRHRLASSDIPPRWRG